MLNKELRIFSLVLCMFLATCGGQSKQEVDLMPLLSNVVPANGRKVQTSASSSVRVATSPHHLRHHLRDSDNFTLRVQFVLSRCLQTVTRFQLYPTNPNGPRLPIVGVDIFPYKHQIDVRFQMHNSNKVETFYYDLEPEVTSELSVVFTGDQLLLYVNCSRIYTRQVGTVDRLVANTGSYEAIFRSKGKCSTGPTNLLAAYLLLNSEYVESLPGCLEHLSSDSDVYKLKQKMVEAKNLLENLTSEVDYLTESLKQWEGCECSRYCIVDGDRVRNGTTWENGPEDCQCVNGETICTCKKLKCYSNQSKYIALGDKCPTCQNDCIERSRRYHHGQTVVENQVTCICLNAMLRNCEKIRPNVSPQIAEPTPSIPSTQRSCSDCCSDPNCTDSDGYCVCSCSKSDFSCTKCSKGHAVNPKSKSCHRHAKILYPNLVYYNTLIAGMY